MVKGKQVRKAVALCLCREIVKEHSVINWLYLGTMPFKNLHSWFNLFAFSGAKRCRPCIYCTPSRKRTFSSSLCSYDQWWWIMCYKMIVGEDIYKLYQDFSTVPVTLSGMSTNTINCQQHDIIFLTNADSDHDFVIPELEWVMSGICFTEGIWAQPSLANTIAVTDAVILLSISVTNAY